MVNLEREGFSPRDQRLGSQGTRLFEWNESLPVLDSGLPDTASRTPQPGRVPFGIDVAPDWSVRHPYRLLPSDYTKPQQCFVTFGTRQRQPLLAEPAVADLVIDAIFASTAVHQLEATAYCLMPDHVHLLFTSEQATANIRAVIESIKQRSGFAYKQRTRLPLWHVSYFDRTLRNEDAALDVVAYILNNPVRAGFVRVASDWPFFGSSRWARAELLEFVATAGPGRRPRG